MYLSIIRELPDESRVLQKKYSRVFLQTYIILLFVFYFLAKFSFNRCNRIPSSSRVDCSANFSPLMCRYISAYGLTKENKSASEKNCQLWREVDGENGKTRPDGRQRKKKGYEKKRKSEEMLNEGEMHNGERRNPLAGMPRNKYAPFVLVRGSVGRGENRKRVAAGGEKRRPRISRTKTRAETNNGWTNIPSSPSSPSSFFSLRNCSRRCRL